MLGFTSLTPIQQRNTKTSNNTIKRVMRTSQGHQRGHLQICGIMLSKRDSTQKHRFNHNRAQPRRNMQRTTRKHQKRLLHASRGSRHHLCAREVSRSCIIESGSRLCRHVRRARQRVWYYCLLTRTIFNLQFCFAQRFQPTDLPFTEMRLLIKIHQCPMVRYYSCGAPI